MSNLAIKILQEVQSAIDNDQLVLPTMPEMALKVREVSEDDNATIQTMADVIHSDTALTARIIKVANSPIFRGAREIEDLNMALSRLGMQYTSNLATGLAMEQMFQATSDFIDTRMREVWTKSSEIAGISYVLCKHLTKLRPDQATLAGLVHKIGALPILSFAEDHPELLRDGITLDNVIEKIHPAIGVQILTAWEFPPEIRKVPEQYIDITRKSKNPDYADVVTIAMLQSYTGSEITKNINLNEVTAFGRLGIEPSIDSAVAQELSEEMEEAKAMLA